jgi:hypothetical protein
MSKETKYLFSKMESVEDGIEHCIRVEEKSAKNAETIYHFEEEAKSGSGKQNCTKWMKNNVMLISTLGAVIFGATSGEKFYGS